MNIFVPVLWICINSNCVFMQQSTHFLEETQCRESLQEQKKKIRFMAKKSKGTVKQLEGMCVSVDTEQSPARVLPVKMLQPHINRIDSA
jgi:hypothetical protein